MIILSTNGILCVKQFLVFTQGQNKYMYTRFVWIPSCIMCNTFLVSTQDFYSHARDAHTEVL